MVSAQHPSHGMCFAAVSVLSLRLWCCVNSDPRLSFQPIYSKQSVFFVWELKWTEEPPPSLHCRFSVGFSPASEEQLSISLKPYTYEFKVENFFVSDVLFWEGGVEK